MAQNGNGKFGGREVVIVEAARTPIGRGHEEKGYYKDTHPSTLLAESYKAVIERAGIEPSEVEDVVAGCVQQFGEQGINIARNGWLEAGLPIETPATTVDRQCGSGQQAVNFAGAMIASGVHDAMIGGGVEHMGHISFADSFSVMEEHGMAFSPELMKLYNLVPQGISAEMIADKWEIPRSELDELALRSHQKAHEATEEGRFEREIIPWRSNGDTYVTDQGIRPPGPDSAEKLASLKPAFKEDGKVTAGNASQVSDGAAAVLLMSAEKAKELGLKARARLVDQTTVGVDPVMMLTGPIPATQKILERNGMTDGRHRPDRDQRGLRLRGRRLAPRAGARHGPRQRQRRRDRAGAPARLDRRPPADQPPARAGALRQGDRPRDDVLRRRPGHRHADPARLGFRLRGSQPALPPSGANAPRRMLGRRPLPRLMAKPSLTAVCVFVAALLAGCGGGDDGGEVTVSADELVPSKRDYIVQADTICANSQQGIETQAEAQFRISSNDFTVTPQGEIVFKPGRRPERRRDREIREEHGGARLPGTALRPARPDPAHGRRGGRRRDLRRR